MVKQPKGNISRKTTSIKLDPAIVKAVKIRAAQDETTISDIVEKALIAYLTKKK
jgi:predicted transcriptional regulator